jgi:hypothetical protein
MSDEPMLPTPAPPPLALTGREPALAGVATAAEVLSALGLRFGLETCGDLSLAEWWRTCSRGEVMAWCLPEGPVDSPTRRKLAGLACRFARLVEPLWPPRLASRVARVEHFAGGGTWRDAPDDPPPPAVRRMRRADHAATRLRNALRFLAERPSLPGRSWAAYAAFSISGFETGSMTAEWLRGRIADLIRETYPDVGLVLAERQPELGTPGERGGG